MGSIRVKKKTRAAIVTTFTVTITTVAITTLAITTITISTVTITTITITIVGHRFVLLLRFFYKSVDFSYTTISGRDIRETFK